ncbi:MAG: cytosine permease [Solirubrobacterales bacterium]|nr:cytosine permease [Solirubrobacterales bacterium]MBV9714227.1 cytosine permease [Solirubrobacterales bacterium]
MGDPPLIVPTRAVEDAPAHGPGGPVQDEPAFEHRGIDYISVSDRRGRPIDLLWMWAGALFNVEYVVYGALIISFGLSFWQAALVIVLGNLSYLVTGIGSLQGPAAGTSVFAITRAPFGPNGGRLVSAFNWMTQVGYETEGLALVVLAGLALAAKTGLHGSLGLKLALVVAAAGVQLVLPVLGHRAMLRILRLLVPPFVVLFVVLAALTLPKVHLGAGSGAGWETVLVALALILSAGGYGWVMNASDYSRYLAPDSSRVQIVASVALGGYVPSTLLALLGAAVATTVPSATDPISGLPHAFSGWFLIPYLIFVIVQLFSINSVDLYSSGLTLQAIIPPIRRWQCVLIDTVVAAVLTAVTIFSSSFNTFLTDFLLFMIIWIAPWVAIFLLDWWLRRGRYDSRSLLSGRAGVYWRHGGIHVPGVVAQLAGMIAAASWLDTTIWKGPLSTATNGADFSVFMGALFGAGVYYVLAGRSVRRESVDAGRVTAGGAPPGAA